MSRFNDAEWHLGYNAFFDGADKPDEKNDTLYNAGYRAAEADWEYCRDVRDEPATKFPKYPSLTKLISSLADKLSSPKEVENTK